MLIDFPLTPPSSKFYNKGEKIEKKNDLNISQHIDIYRTMTDKMKFTETYDIDKVRWISNRSSAELKSFFYNKFEVNQDGEKSDFKTCEGQIRKLCFDILKHYSKTKSNQLVRKYRYATSMKEGRIYTSEFSLQSTQGELRRFLNGDYTHDVDICSAHPSILKKIMVEFNEEFPKYELLEENSNLFAILGKYEKNKQKLFDKYDFDKVDFNTALNSDIRKTNKKDKGFFTNNEFLKQFHTEKQEVYKIIYKCPEIKKRFNFPTTNKENPISSFMNRMFCVRENEYLQKAIRIIEEEGGEVEFPMYDGCCVRKSEDIDLDKIIKRISDETKLNWIEKPNTSYIEMDEEESEDYFTKREEFENSSCKIEAPHVYIQQIRNEEGRLQDHIYNMTDFTNKHRNFRIQEGCKDIPFTQKWFEDEDMLTYNGMTFKPYSLKENDTTNQKFYNMFRGYDAEIVKDYDTSICPGWFKDYVYNGLGNENEEVGAYLMKLFAMYVKMPQKRTEILLVIRGNQGTGKDTLINIIEAIFGEQNDYVYRTANLQDAFPDGSGFNSSLKSKLMLQFNEVQGSDSYKVKEKLKDQTTRARNNIKEKYIQDYSQENFINQILISNSKAPCSIEWKERRTYLIKTADYHKGDTAWWSDFYTNYVNNKERINELFTYLMSIDLTDFKPSRDRVLTDEYKNLQKTQLPNTIKYLNHLITNDFKDWKTYNPRKTEKNPNPKSYKIIKQKVLLDKLNFHIETEFNVYYKVKLSELQKELQEFKGVAMDKPIKIGGKTINHIILEPAIFNADFASKYEIEVEEVLEIGLDELSGGEGCLLGSESDDELDM